MAIAHPRRIVAALAAIVAIAPQVRGDIRVLGVATSAGFAPGLPGPGSPAAIFCTGLTITGTIVVSPLRPVVEGISVTYGDSFRAPIYGVADLGSYQIVNFQVPWENHPAPLILSQGSDSVAIDASPAAWGQFFTDAQAFAIAVHATDFSLITIENPVQPGEWVALWGSNFGPVAGPPATGEPAPLDRAIPLDPGAPIPWTFTVWLRDPSGNRLLAGNFIGLAPGSVGAYQINLQMPDTLPASPVQLYVQRVRDCGFFFTPGCGRGVILDISATAKLY